MPTDLWRRFDRAVLLRAPVVWRTRLHVFFLLSTCLANGILFGLSWTGPLLYQTKGGCVFAALLWLVGLAVLVFWISTQIRNPWGEERWWVFVRIWFYYMVILLSLAINVLVPGDLNLHSLDDSSGAERIFEKLSNLVMDLPFFSVGSALFAIILLGGCLPRHLLGRLFNRSLFGSWSALTKIKAPEIWTRLDQHLVTTNPRLWSLQAHSFLLRVGIFGSIGWFLIVALGDWIPGLRGMTAVLFISVLLVFRYLQRRRRPVHAVNTSQDVGFAVLEYGAISILLIVGLILGGWWQAFLDSESRMWIALLLVTTAHTWVNFGYFSSVLSFWRLNIHAMAGIIGGIFFVPVAILMKLPRNERQFSGDVVVDGSLLLALSAGFPWLTLGAVALTRANGYEWVQVPEFVVYFEVLLCAFAVGLVSRLMRAYRDWPRAE